MTDENGPSLNDLWRQIYTFLIRDQFSPKASKKNIIRICISELGIIYITLTLQFVGLPMDVIGSPIWKDFEQLAIFVGFLKTFCRLYWIIGFIVWAKLRTCVFCSLFIYL